MSQPTDAEITRSLTDLRKCASVWTAEGETLTTKHAYYNGHLASGTSFGIFIGAGMAYQDACEAIAEAVRTGGTALGGVGTTLEEVATAYELDEQNNVHLSQQEW